MVKQFHNKVLDILRNHFSLFFVSVWTMEKFGEFGSELEGTLGVKSCVNQ